MMNSSKRLTKKQLRKIQPLETQMKERAPEPEEPQDGAGQQIITEDEKLEAARRMSGLNKYRVQRPEVVVPVEEVLDENQGFVLISIASEFTTCKTKAPQIRVCGFYPTAKEAFEWLDMVFPDPVSRDCDWVVHPAGKPLIVCRNFRNQTNKSYILKRYEEIMRPYCQELERQRKEFEENLEQKKEGNMKDESLETKRRKDLIAIEKKEKQTSRFQCIEQTAKRKKKFGTKHIKEEFQDPNCQVVCLSVVPDYAAGTDYPEPIIFAWRGFPRADHLGNDPAEAWFKNEAKNAILDLEIVPAAGYQWLPITRIDLTKVKKVYRDSFVQQIVTARELEEQNVKSFQQECKFKKLKMKTTEFSVEKDQSGKVKPVVKKQITDFADHTVKEYTEEEEEARRKTEIVGFSDKTPQQLMDEIKAEEKFE